MSNILIVHAHHEPRSFSSSMARLAAETFGAQGHGVTFSDLSAMGFQPVSDRRNFTTTADPAYLKQQQEEAFATGHDGFAPDVEAEIRKLEACDLLVFSFPLWWFGMPAILKGWVDRIFAYRRIYARGRWYEDGVGKGKRAMVLMTTGGEAGKYAPGGLHPTLDQLLAPVHEGIFWFNGFSPLPPFVAWAAAHGSDAERHATLASLRQRLQRVFSEPVIELPPARDFDPETAADAQSRFMVTVTRARDADEHPAGLIPSRIDFLKDLRRQGKLLSLHVSRADATEWRAYFLMRAPGQDVVRDLCGALPHADSLAFEITPLEMALAM